MLCEMIEKCPFFEKHYPEKDGMYKGWVKSFCENDQKSQDCKRKQYFINNNMPAPEDMTPTGLYINQI